MWAVERAGGGIRLRRPDGTPVTEVESAPRPCQRFGNSGPMLERNCLDSLWHDVQEAAELRDNNKRIQ